MKPYYSDDSVTLYHGDSLEDDGALWTCADVLVSDVPYGIDYRSNQRRQTLARSIAGDRNTEARDHALRCRDVAAHLARTQCGGGYWA